MKGAEFPEVSMMPTTVPYVPATVTNDPKTTIKILKHTIGNQDLECPRPVDQWSYSHIQPYGWRQRIVPSRAPIKETRASNAGIVLAMMYAITVMPKVQPSQQAQCVKVLVFRWREPRRM